MSRRQAFSLLLVLCLSVPAVRAADRPVTDADVQKGIQQVDEGDYDSAIFTLDSASRRLAAAKGDANDLAQAYLYLGIAYIGKGREAAAKQQFREAIGQIKDLTLSADRFPPKVIDAFAAAKEEASRDASATAATTTTTSATPEKKGGSHKGLIIGGVVIAGGAAAALAAGGGGGGSSSSGSTPPAGNPSAGLNTLTFTGTVGTSNDTQGYMIVATKSGTMTASLQWQNGQVGLNIGCQEHDPPYNGCNGTFNRTSNTTAQYTVPVTQRSYDILVQNFDSNSAAENYTLTVTFP